ncbi:MAG TPA: hypothetical protein VM032_08705 [Vicinamibacterales bacterium]|nr:hypothetical protein [Vicinamibacterales bacterium]
MRALSLRTPAAAFVFALLVYGVVAGSRLVTQTSDRHFVAQADAWRHGRLALARWPAGADDPAVVEHVALDDGTVVRGRRLLRSPTFHVAGGGNIPMSRVRESRGADYQVAFPPFPSAVFLPLVVIFGSGVSDVVVTVVAGALAPALLLVVLARLRELGLSRRSPGEELWLAALLSFGTVLFYSAVQGRVWYTAHVFAVDLCLLYVWAAIGAGRPFLAGLCLGLAFLTRAPMLFMFPLFAGEMWRTRRLTDWRGWASFVIPVALAGVLAAWHNDARFGEPLEFGYSYLRVRQQMDIEQYGLFHSHYLRRNLVAAFALLPDVSLRPLYLAISGHGLAIWVTTPALLLLAGAWPRTRFQCELWVTAAAVAVWTLFYQNTGWFQFGFRFSLDYVVFLMLILAVHRRPIGGVAQGLIVASIAINLFGAVTFNRYPQFYRADRAAYEALVHD